MISPPDRNRPVVRCGTCPGAPVLATHNPQHKDYLCVRCQDHEGKGRALEVPHPPDHLCAVCRLECPSCQAPTPDGQPCRSCRRICRTCSTPLPELPAPRPTVIEPQDRKDRRRRWKQHFYDRPALREQCDSCRQAADAHDPVGTVLAALPEKVVRACHGRIPATVIDTVRTELNTRTPHQLTARIERRWWKNWAHQRLHRDPDDMHEGWTPDNIALWLVTPTPCAGRCEDGWHPAHDPDQDDTPCPTCQGGRLLANRTSYDDDTDDGNTERASTAADRSLTEAVTYRATTRECTGRDGACGVPVAAPYDQCPACAGWPYCPTCQHRRYNPDQATACQVCTALRAVN
ncbi:hypothetical protein QLX52_30540 [Streptomyces albus]|uniref:hypothetical protein n=1 Tax=Streptomyces albus TaxID=1888 RepID=UPI0024AD4E26|nr:hypothetical protein [Streptomyces albus]MDI6413148.1 hypothetical protein [Streptomyces albus]